jgi:hypothetical protein
MIDKIFDLIKQEALELKNNDSISMQEKFEQMDILLNIMRMLKDYDENIIVLDKYWRERDKENSPEAILQRLSEEEWEK